MTNGLQAARTGVPLAIEAVSPSTTSAIITLRPPSYHGGSPVHSYRVIAVRQGSNIVAASMTSTTNSMIMKGLKPNTKYQLIAEAINDASAGPAAASALATLPSAAAAAAPTIQGVTVLPQGQVHCFG